MGPTICKELGKMFAMNSPTSLWFVWFSSDLSASLAGWAIQPRTQENVAASFVSIGWPLPTLISNHLHCHVMNCFSCSFALVIWI
jgi:hypothetical protein